ncbi:MAG: TlpA family protein disulfide reductase [Lachnospiraceae bacterium]|nr:TlpA family protein disulfide reductase [Lachnospiraceae bacterium]
MENKKTLIIVSILLVAFIGGASLLYAKLGTDMKPDNLLIQNNGGSTTTDTTTVTPEVSANDTADNSDKTPVTPGNSSETDDSSSESNGTASGNSTEGNATAGTSPFMAPDFTVYDREGNTVRLSDFLGKPVVLNFWASWCGPCKSEMPDFEEIYKEYGEDIHFVMVNLTDGDRETMDTATTFLDSSGYTFPVYYDKDIDAAYTYQVYGIPVTYFINAEGHLIAQGSSALDAETIKRGIEMILK